MKKPIKIIVASTITWVSFVFAHNAIFEWASFPWERYSGAEFVYACLFPPAVCLLGFVLFKWAFGEGFVQWIKSIRPNISVGIIILFSVVAAVNASNAASEASNAASEASEAGVYAQEAASSCER